MKNGIDLPCTNWLEIGAVLSMSPIQDETNPHRNTKLWRERLGLMKVFM